MTTLPDYPFSSNFLQLPEGRLHYVDEGTGPAVLLVHGNPTWSYYFRHLITTLSENFRVIAVDHLGCGLSDKPQRYPYRLQNHIDNLESLLEELEIKEASLVVHDWGGPIGLGYFTRNIERLRRLVVLNTAAFHAPYVPWRIRVCAISFIGALIVRGFNGFAWPATWMAVNKPLAPSTKKAYLLPYNSWRHRIGVHRFVRDIPLSKQHPTYSLISTIEAGLPRIKEHEVPLMIVWGGKDFCFNRYYFEQWRIRFPDAHTHYLAEAGHYVLEDGHGVVEPIIKDFFCADGREYR